MSLRSSTTRLCKSLCGCKGLGNAALSLQGETVAELAGKMGVSADNLQKTLAQYGEGVCSGVDREFGREHNLSTDFSTPPYYAVKTTPGIQVTLGGIEVNDNMQVLNRSGRVIEGLYAVGEVAHDELFGTGPTAINICYGKKVAEHILSSKL